ncbi:hypothetical protein YC2023_031982 [Brassica napus]
MVALPLTPSKPEMKIGKERSLSGKYNTVVCLDVLIHYPQNKADGMIAHLASLAEKRVILSFAPKTFYYDILKRIGELFSGPSKATRAYLHAEADVERALRKVGCRISKSPREDSLPPSSTFPGSSKLFPCRLKTLQKICCNHIEGLKQMLDCLI